MAAGQKAKASQESPHFFLVDPGFAWKRCSKQLTGQGEFLDKDALFASMDFRLMLL
jgi:hypothetical protein